MKKIAVLMGGSSAERAISLQSGQAVLTALQQQGMTAIGIDVDHTIIEQLIAGQYSHAFIALHGRGGEDGQIQAVLSSLGIAYTGSSVTGSVLSMNKAVSKAIWQQQGLPTAAFQRITQETHLQTVIDDIGSPLIVKPASEGSSIGMNRVNQVSELEQALQLANDYDDEVIAERWIDGSEYTVAILDDTALPIIQLKTPHAFYDYAAKYEANTTQYCQQTDLSSEEKTVCQQLALSAFKALHMSGWGRIDIMRCQKGQFYLLEANSVPGMTAHSLVPMAAKSAGITMSSLVQQILSLANTRRQ